MRRPCGQARVAPVYANARLPESRVLVVGCEARAPRCIAAAGTVLGRPMRGGVKLACGLPLFTMVEPKAPTMTVESLDVQPKPSLYVEEVEIQGHIIDSLILPKVLDLITSRRRHVPHQADHDRPGAATIPATPWSRCRPPTRRHAGRDPRPDRRPRGRAHRAARTASWSRPTWTAPFPRASTARPTSGPRSAWAASGSRSRTRRWTAASSSIAAGQRPAACR